MLLLMILGVFFFFHFFFFKQKTAYEMRISDWSSDVCSSDLERHVLTITVDNESGILAKIAGLFTARGYNIDSLTVADISENHAVSRITIVTNGPPQVIDQIEAQLERLVPVHKVTDLTQAGPHVERELALIKVAGTGDKRVESLRIAELFRANVVDTTIESFVFELTGSPDKIDSRSEERRVGKECVSTCKSRGSPVP